MTTNSNTPLKQKLYVKEPGDPSKIAAADIEQGQTGDCFFLAALEDIALVDPSFISDDIIKPNGDGTETVALYRDAAGGPPTYLSTALTPSPTQVSNKFSANAVNDYNTNDIVRGTKEIWPQVIEKAFAQEVGGFGVLNQGGNPGDAMEALTGQHATYMYAQSLTPATLASLANTAGSIITFDTIDRPSDAQMPFNLVGDHAYAFVGLEDRNGQTYVDLLNPWGFKQPDAIPFSQIATDFVGINHGTI